MKEKSKEERQRWYAKWIFSGYLCVGVFSSLYLFLFDFDTLAIISVALIELMCLLQMGWVILYSHKEIYKFLRRKIKR